MHVKMRERIFGRHQRIYAVKTGQKRDQPTGTRDEDGSSTLPNEGRVADEMDRVAGPLLSVQQDGAPFNRLPVPTWLSETGGWNVGRAQSPFVLRPAALEVAQPQPDQHSIEPQGRIVRRPL